MKQTQQQILGQSLSLTQGMRHSLSLLHMRQEDIAKEIENERKRNPFLKIKNVVRFASSECAPEHLQTERLAQTTTPAQTLLRQIGLIRFSQTDRKLASELVYCLDERGFLTDSLDEICGYLNVSLSQLRRVLTHLRTLEPAGVFACSLSDCFRLQLKARNRLDPIIELILKRLDLVARRDIEAICKLCNVDCEDAQEIIADIRALSPAPFSQLEPPFTGIRRPDLIIEPDDENGFKVRLNPDALPDILTDDALFCEHTKVEPDRSTIAYYRDCYRGASALVTALQKRANTLLLIGEHIVCVQRRFLQTGRKLDRVPLSMGDMARLVGRNKSTISRALNGCLIETQHGLVEAADFFARRLSDNAENKTIEQALKRLGLLIKIEDKSRPFSDQSLASQMSRINFTVTRRTVTKYRKILGIPRASLRRSR